MRLWVLLSVLAATPPAAASLWNAGRLIEKKDWDGATIALKKVRGRAAYYLRGRALEAQEKVPEAIKAYAKARWRPGALAEEMGLRRARLLLSSGKMAKAEKLFRYVLRRIKDRPSRFRGAALRGAVAARARRGHCGQAAKVLRQLAKKADMSWPSVSLLAIAECYLANGKTEEAAKRFEWLTLYRRRSDAARKARENLKALAGKGVFPPAGSFDEEIEAVAALRRARRVEAAKARLARIQAKGKAQTRRVAYEAAELLHKSGKHREAADAFRAIFRKYKKAPWVEGYLRHQASCLRHVRDHHGSGMAYLAADEATPKRRRKGRDLWRAGVAFERAGEPERAAAAFLKLAKREWRHRDAIKAYVRAVEALFEGGKFAEGAKAASKFPKRWSRRRLAHRARWLHAWSLTRAGEKKKALGVLEKIVRRRRTPDREKIRARYWMARIAEATDAKKAAGAYSKLVREHPTTFYADMALARLRAIAPGASPPAQALHLEPGAAPKPPPSSRATASLRHRDKRTAYRLRKLAKKHGDDIPSFSEASALYALGLVREATIALRRAQRTIERARYRPRRRYAFTELSRAGGTEQEKERRKRLRKLDRAKMALQLAGLFEKMGDAERAAENRRRFGRAKEGRRVRGLRGYPLVYRDLVAQASQEHGVAPALLFALIRQESAFRTDALSDMGARGLMQIIPKTARRIAKRLGKKTPLKMLDDPALSLRYGAWYIRQLLDKYRGQVPLAIAAYNAGPKAVSRWIDLRGRLPLDAFLEEIPYRETRQYVRKVLSSTRAYAKVLGQLRAAYARAQIDRRYGDNINF